MFMFFRKVGSTVTKLWYERLDSEPKPKKQPYKAITFDVFQKVKLDLWDDENRTTKLKVEGIAKKHNIGKATVYRIKKAGTWANFRKR